MRILHTADWHMNARLGHQDRTQDIVASLERVAAYLDEYDVDVMVVAGDLFCDRSDRNALREAVGQIRRIFEPFLTRPSRPGTILAISGNHDNDIFFETLRHALDLAPAPVTADGTLALGRMYLYHRPNLVRVADQNGTMVQFLLMPYPKEAWLRGLEYETSAGQNRIKQDRFTQYLRNELMEKKLDPTLPAVLVSHILVEGVSARQGYRLGLEHDVVFSPGDVPTGLAYIAYGHIHQQQEAVANASWIRYCGSVERLDGGERNDDKSVVLVEVGPEGRVGEPITLPLDATPIVRLEYAEGDDPDVLVAGLESDWAVLEERKRVLVSIRLYYTPGVHAPDDLRERLHQLFPRLYECDLCPVRVSVEGRRSDAGLSLDLADVAKTATDYVSAKLNGDERREALLSVLRDLLTEDAPGAAHEEGENANMAHEEALV